MSTSEAVDLRNISGHFDIQKTSAMLLVISGQELLLQTFEHQGGLVCDAFGTFADGGDTMSRLMQLQKEYFSSSFPLQPAGKVITYINKPQPDGRVRLTVDAYVAELSQKQKTSLPLKQNQLWLDAGAISRSDIIREDDKLLFTKALTDHTLNIVMDVDQPGAWVRAKLLAWAKLAK